MSCKANCLNLDLANAPLNKITVAYVGTSSRVNLNKIKLYGADLSGANLQGVDLIGANLEEVDLSEANLQGADLSDANLQGADLSRADLKDVRLNATNLTGANLSEVDLQGNNLDEVNLESANLSEANLQDVGLNGTNLCDIRTNEKTHINFNWGLTVCDYTSDTVILGNEEIVYLLSKTKQSIFRWSVQENGYLRTIPLDITPNDMVYSKETNRLYLVYPSGRISKIQLGNNSFNEQFFAYTPLRKPRGLVTVGKYLLVCEQEKKGSNWDKHVLYNSDGEIISSKGWNHCSQEYVWSEANQKIYFFRANTIPKDLLWEDIDNNGVIGEYKDSPYHDSRGIDYPIRVSPDGSQVLLGSGRIYDAISLKIYPDILPNEIEDAAWKDRTLFTLRTVDNISEIQQWNSDFKSVDKNFSVNGEPVRLFSVSEGLLIISNYSNKPLFSIINLEIDG
jgi:hypothetical protein